jgi:ABC-type antimicrobial peptide transport system ATPase subunit
LKFEIRNSKFNPSPFLEAILRDPRVPGGMKQRFGIAQALINDPELVIVERTPRPAVMAGYFAASIVLLLMAECSARLRRAEFP